jgi:glycosyltransferase involved in cell wall biosynthesis
MLNDNFYRGSGVTIAIRRIISTPAFQGIDVYLAGCEKIARKRSLQEDRSMVSAERYRFFPLMESSVELLPALFRFGTWVREMRFDVLHAHHRRLAVLANLIRPFSKVPVLFTGHGTFPASMWFRELAPRTATGVSPAVVEYLQRCTKAAEISLVYNPLDFPDHKTDASTFYTNRVVSVGRLEPGKGHDTLIEAWAALKQKGIKAQLDIFGEGSLRNSLESQIADRVLQGNVKLCGFAADIAEQLPAYAFNVLVSEREGFPNAVVEAAAHSLPTLLTDVRGCRDALPPQLALPNGLVYGDAMALSDTLAHWLSSPQLLQEDGKRFHDYLRCRCSPEVVGERYVEAYSSLLEVRY